MRNAVPGQREGDLSQVVLISNSMPKSGSSLLFSLQCELLQGLLGRPLEYNALEAAGIPVAGGFIEPRDISKFVDFVNVGGVTKGPLLIKTHAVVDGPLLALFTSNPNVFMSTIIRDPRDVFVSARRNYWRTGEFAKFADLDAGIKVVDGFYRDICESSLAAAAHKELPILRYEELMEDRLSVLRASFPKALADRLWNEVFRKFLDVGRAEERAAHRRSQALDAGYSANRDEEKLVRTVEVCLQGLRQKLGYA